MRPLVALAIIASDAPTAAQTYGDVNAIMTVRGQCERLVLADEDRSAFCQNSVVILTYGYGRTSFLFSDRERGTVFSFSGTEGTNRGDEATLALDKLTRASNPGPTLRTEDITGNCFYQNPFAGRAIIRCEGTTASGAFAASLTSDGTTPETVRP